MIIKSIKWRLLLWMACFLTLILAGLGIAVYEIHLTKLIGQFDEELRQRIVRIGTVLHAPPFPIDMDQPPLLSEQSGNPPPPIDQSFGEPPDSHLPPPELVFGPRDDSDMALHAREFEEPPDEQGKPPIERRVGRLPEAPSFEESGVRVAQLVNSLQSLFNETNTGGFYYIVWRRMNNTPLVQSTNAPADVIRPKPAHKDTGTYMRNRGSFREAYHATERGDCILIGRSMAPEYANAQRFAGWLGLGGLVVVAMILTGSWWLLVRALMPVEKISAAALKISSGDLSQRISVAETESELGKLAVVLNSTFERLETAFAQQKQFTSDASHELRTPIAVLISETQTMLSRDRRPDEYRESMSVCLETAQKMRRLTESLLELARLDAGQDKLRMERNNLPAVVLECVEFVRPLATERNVHIHCDLKPVEAVCDASRMAQVVINLLTNAIKYNKEGGSIHISTSANDGTAILTVADTGLGIASHDLPRVFERFYRADKSRSTGGNGLGLSICKAIVSAHGGTIDVASEENKGTTFTVVLSNASVMRQ